MARERTQDYPFPNLLFQTDKPSKTISAQKDGTVLELKWSPTARVVFGQGLSQKRATQAFSKYLVFMGIALVTYLITVEILMWLMPSIKGKVFSLGIPAVRVTD